LFEKEKKQWNDKNKCCGKGGNFVWVVYDDIEEYYEAYDKRHTPEASSLFAHISREERTRPCTNSVDVYKKCNTANYDVLEYKNIENTQNSTTYSPGEKFFSIKIHIDFYCF